MSDSRRRDIDAVRRGDVRLPTPVPPPERMEPAAAAAPGEEGIERFGPAATALHEEGAERPPWVAAVGTGLLAIVACIPHWVAPVTALLIALVGLPIAWGFRRVTTGRRQRLFVAVALALVVTIVLSIALPLVWLRLGLLEVPEPPPVP